MTGKGIWDKTGDREKMQLKNVLIVVKDIEGSDGNLIEAGTPM